MDWFTDGVIAAQVGMLFAAGFLLAQSAYWHRRSGRLIDQQQALMKEALDIITYQSGIIAALHAGVISPWHIRPIDFSKLPIELRLRILYALIDVGVTARMGSEK